MISVCMIARNEEGFISKAIASTEGLADEVVVFDTGSSDSTIKEAREAGARALTGGDRMNKSAVRNQGFAAAKGEWIVTLDCDERVVDPVGLREFLESTDAGAVYGRLRYMKGDRCTLEYSQLRCWRKGLIECKYRAHEVPMPPNGEWPKIVYTDFVWEHRPVHKPWKLQYTLDRLLLDVEENPDDARPMYYLGRQYMYLSEWELAIEWLEKYLTTSGKYDRADAWHCIAKCHAGLKDGREQICALHMACAEAPERREWWGTLAEIYHAEGRDQVAVGLLKYALEQPSPARLYHIAHWFGPHIYDLLARCLWKLERYEEGREHARKALSLEPNDERLRNNLMFFESQF